jgi:hypothetical protein
VLAALSIYSPVDVNSGMEAYELIVSKAVEDGVIPGAIFLASDIEGNNL